ncbi:NTP transferase domain-containing protein [Nocardia sp. NBC_01503]|uniref:nucleotidyltransferase family protein n=1 Tax=Nocardia sp. NBC_01503 TaxID=2975997 RepID=UPI002E7BA945|nr:NTP transferase domain-containing protein [Nocardia sp. NBC_01503]WTL35170.1 NTP transferase domain-containing protein [Nocardia sp. NBC_01503]
MTPERCDGLVLAAGAGTRYGMPKALAEDGAWLRTAVHALRAGGCARVFVVLGATGPASVERETGSAPTWLVSQTPRIPVPAGAHPVWAADWATGVSASLRAGLAAVASVGSAKSRARHADHELAEGIAADRNIAARISPAGNSREGNIDEPSAPPEYVAIMPVDTPDVGPEVVRRVIAAARTSESGLARAYFGNTPGHPVILGRGHWADVTANASGNYGAGTYLRGRPDMVCVTCDDLATGIDRDYPCGTR